MTLLRLIAASLTYHARMHAAVACGVAVATAVLTGALVVGDSMRASLRRLTLQRLGRIDDALVTDRFFRVALADEWASAPALRKRTAQTVPAIVLRASLQSTGPDAPRRANHVNLVGCDGRFWELGHGGPAQPPEARQIVLNAPLAEQLGVGPGDPVLLRMPRPGTIPEENPLGRRTETVETQRVVVREVVPAEGMGRFSLRPDQRLPRNAYVDLDWLQERLGQPQRANAVFVASAAKDAPSEADDEAFRRALSPTPADYGLHIQRTPRGYLNLTTDRMIFDPAAQHAILAGLGAQRVQPALTYLANSIARGEREIPYSTITAVDFAAEPPLGPMVDGDGRAIAPLGEGEIALNAWAADDLGVRLGETIRVRYFEPHNAQGELRERSEEFRLAAIVALTAAADDRDFTPEVPGVTDQLSIADWNPPFPFDARRMRKKDEQYWAQRRGTPKAFVSLATGRRLWGSRFGETTSFRLAASDGLTAEGLTQQLSLDPAELGFVVQPVKRQGLAASSGTTSFEGLFLGFSFFLIAAAVMLVAILFRLGIERRATEMGIASAVGLRRRQVAGWLVAEGLVVSAAGSALGVAAGIAYAALMLAGLQTWWVRAVGSRFLSLYAAPTSLAIGYACGIAVALGAILWTAWRSSGSSPRALLAGQVFSGAVGARRPGRTAQRTAAGLLALAVVLGWVGRGMSQEAQAGVFFGAGAAVLAATLVWVGSRLGRGATGSAVAAGRGNLARLALRSAARLPGRSTLTIGLVAAATFLIVAVSAFRLDPGIETLNRDGGAGGFELVAESDQPLFHDLNSAEGRAELGFTPRESQIMETARSWALRVRPGDDASCLNLYRPEQPRMLGVPDALVERGGFAWADYRAAPEPGDGPPNPWRLLRLDLGVDDDGVPRVPVVLEKNTATYSLHLGGVGETLEIADGRGGKIRLQIVGLLGGSILQGDLLIHETAFLKYFPQQTGYRFFLLEVPTEHAIPVQAALQSALADYGLVCEPAAERWAAFQAVQNTYLSTFQSLGGLGLLLGTFGLAAVQLRSVLERQRELALLRAIGFRRRSLALLVTLESALLLLAGLACGVLSALVAILPHLVAGGARVPWLWLTLVLLTVLAAGLAASLLAARAALKTPLLASLRSD